MKQWNTVDWENFVIKKISILTKLKLTKHFSNIDFLLAQTAFWINTKISNMYRWGIQSSVKTDRMIFIQYDCQTYSLDLAIVCIVSYAWLLVHKRLSSVIILRRDKRYNWPKGRQQSFLMFCFYRQTSYITQTMVSASYT